MKNSKLQLSAKINATALEVIDASKSESENRDFILSKICKNNIYKHDNKKYFINKEVYVPYRQIYIPQKDNDDVELEIWCYKQDICIYKSLYQNKKDKNTLKNSNGEEIRIKLDRIGNNIVALPLLIIEVKKSPVNTHELLAYSEKAKLIKNIFPYCKYLLLVIGELSKKIYLQKNNFDEILFYENNDKVKGLRKKVKNYLDKIKSDIEEINKIKE